MYALIQVFIMVERFAVVEVAGLEAGTQFCSESGTLDRCEIAKLSTNTCNPPPQTLSCLAAANGILSPGEHFSGTIYVTGRYSAGAHYFSGMGSYLVCIAKRSCSCRGMCRGHITTEK